MKGLSWKPKLLGDTYCAPACGRGCKHEEFLRAKKNAELIASKLPGFSPYLNENLGWFPKAKREGITISPASYRPDGSIMAKDGFYASYEGDGIVSAGKTPMDALVNMYKYFAGRAIFHIKKRDSIYNIIQEVK